VGALYHKLETQSSAPEDVGNHRPKHVDLIGIINKPLLLHLVGCLYYFHLNIFYCKLRKDVSDELCKYKQVQHFVFCIFLVPGTILEEAVTFFIWPQRARN
jgi:hypothetical protein